jgi:putative intracellular protease/amidase
MALGAIHVVIFDGFADWEPAHALAELRRSGNRDVVAVGFNNNPVVSMGGLRVLPDRSLAEVTPDQIGLFILPGGDLWGTGNYPEPGLSALLRQLDASGVPIAAICGGTLALARAGLLNDRRHTSTVPGDLNVAPEYSGAAHYVTAPAVADRGVITASGLASVDFAREVFAMLGVFSSADQATWFDMYKSGQLPGTAGDE